jgi:ribosome-binding factor A
MSYRIPRINQLIRQELSELLRLQVRDPRLSSFVAVTEVSTSADLKHSMVYISFMGSEEEKQETLKVLTAASGFLRREMAKHVKLRRIPELSFHWDNSIERGDHLMRLIDQVNAESEL